jgi:hypothetical protein
MEAQMFEDYPEQDCGLEDFGYFGDEFLMGDCQEDWALAQAEASDFTAEQWEMAGDDWEDAQEDDGADDGHWDDDPSPYEGNYSEE